MRRLVFLASLPIVAMVTGAITEFPVPTANSLPSWITAGPDGNLWFTESYGDKIGRVTPTGAIVELSLPRSNSGPTGIAAGLNGSVWSTEYTVSRIGAIRP
jgi:streptogramin lyase